MYGSLDFALASVPCSLLCLLPTLPFSSPASVSRAAFPRLIMIPPGLPMSGGGIRLVRQLDRPFSVFMYTLGTYSPEHFIIGGGRRMDVLHSWGTIFTWPACIGCLHIISFLLCDLACSNLLTLEHSSNQSRTACLTSLTRDLYCTKQWTCGS